MSSCLFADDLKWGGTYSGVWSGFGISPYTANDLTKGKTLVIFCMDYNDEIAPPMEWQANIRNLNPTNVTQHAQFGGSYGHRGFTDGLGLLAVFLAAFFDWAARRRRVNVVTAVGSSLAVTLSIVQMIQYWRGVVPIANTTWDQYRALFPGFR